ncbi:hypothetical protein FOYG_16057 [Fusarium oxysporum NRRL 32931]|uniref:Uncharacterized protein n=1 Tax=Fusarium oxysporum NRRL 32931 TaxID=660029 RepID=W9HGZ9_FUSOX|nr:hypothetical protein FOYG_16057 [Fusarium oxysporum NRRL 32931]
MLHIPGASDADCAPRYRDELKTRDDEDKEKELQYTAEQEPHEKLPGLVSSQKGAYLGYHGVIYVYKDPVWKHEDEEQSIDVVEFDTALTADDYDLGELAMRGPQPPFKVIRMSAKRKSKVLRYEDQGVWLWFFDHRAWGWCDPTTTATSQAQHIGWTSWQ